MKNVNDDYMTWPYYEARTPERAAHTQAALDDLLVEYKTSHHTDERAVNSIRFFVDPDKFDKAKIEDTIEENLDKISNDESREVEFERLTALFRPAFIKHSS